MKNNRFAETFSNGVRRCDLEAVIVLALEERAGFPVAIADLLEWCAVFDEQPKYQQLQSTLEKMERDGKIAHFSFKGKHFWELAPQLEPKPLGGEE